MNTIIQQTKNGYTPADIMSSLKAEMLARWQGIGRNDLCPCGSGLKAKYCCLSKKKW
jgi:uncharacterized protein